MRSSIQRYAAPIAAAVLMALPGLALAQTEIQGNIISNDGSKMVVRSNAGVETTVTLTPNTKVQAIIGLVGARRGDRTQADLIKGLLVTVETVQNGAELDADTVTYNPKDLRTAQAVQAGVEQGRQQIIAAQQENIRRQNENARRIALSGQYSEKASARVFFATGSTTINAQGKADLAALMQKAQAIPGYALRVVGHADTVGNPATNQRLSDQRATAVTAYLVRQLGVPPTKMLAPAAMGDVSLNDEDMAPGPNAQARRVTVFVVVSKAAEEPMPTSDTSTPPSASPTPTSGPATPQSP
ncbi:MAG: OmpA family protein [Caulobacteraceae bacterium]|nr:OmpA family protein [Caulobacteraceae bacterium]